MLRPSSPSSRGLILIVDDEITLARVVARLLARAHDALVASSPAEAMAFVREHGDAIDLVLCDVILGETNGIALRESAALACAALRDRFVFVSGGGLPAAIRARITSAGCSLLEKPVEPDDLLAIVSARVSSNR